MTFIVFTMYKYKEIWPLSSFSFNYCLICFCIGSWSLFNTHQGPCHLYNGQKLTVILMLTYVHIPYEKSRLVKVLLVLVWLLFNSSICLTVDVHSRCPLDVHLATMYYKFLPYLRLVKYISLGVRGICFFPRDWAIFALKQNLCWWEIARYF